VIEQEPRLRGLIDAGIALGSELSLDALLQKLVETAGDLTGARYAALGVIDRTGSQLERFVTAGIDAETRAVIGELPRGRGILGVLIREARPLRLHDLTQDPRSVGFPPGHPPMRTFLGVPIMLRGVAFGNLYLTEKDDNEDFTEEDEEIVSLLASQAAVAIENARLYESATRWSRQLESLHEIGNVLATEIQLPGLLELIASRLRQLIDARVVAVALPAHGGDLRIEAVAGGEDEIRLLGTVFPSSSSKSRRVLERRRSERVDSLLDDPEIDQVTTRQIGAQTGLFVPLIVRDRGIGVLMAHDKVGSDHRFTEEDLRLAETLASRAAVAVDMSQRVERESLRRILEAQELERRRLALELHDETGQALTSVLLGLRAVEETVNEDVNTALGDVRELVVGALQDVRRLAVELRPKVLDDFGLVPALERLTSGFTDQTGIAVELEPHLLATRLPSEIETALYRIVQEALTNIVKHAQATKVSVVLTRADGSVKIVVEDDGRGFSRDESSGEGLGLVGMHERIALLNGRLDVESSPGAGTTLVAEVPLP
jgi:two-component system, NarL family, sensor histidine kinase DevS